VPGTLEIALAYGTITGNGTYSFALAAPADTLTIYSSREGSVVPELVVTTTPPPPAPPPSPPAGRATGVPADPAPNAPGDPGGRVPVPPATSTRSTRPMLTAAGARQHAAQAIRRRVGNRWTLATARKLACRRLGWASFTCRASWRSEGRRYSARVTVARRGASLTSRVLVVRHQR
jgi:hypothetical protein